MIVVLPRTIAEFVADRKSLTSAYLADDLPLFLFRVMLQALVVKKE